MQHRLPLAELGRHGDAMARAVSACVHCGFCLPACPTYRVLGEEMDSPRGRILLMKHALEGTVTPAEAAPYVDRCLGCLACETACPSGVRYRDLIAPYRARMQARTSSPLSRLARAALLAAVERPNLLRPLARFAPLARPVRSLLPRSIARALSLLPTRLPHEEPLPAHIAAAPPRRARVALLTGCVQRVLRPSITAAACRVLAANGVEVLIPGRQGCCGALARHLGLEARADALAAHNRSVFSRRVDAIVTTAAGCGSAMKDEASGGPAVRDIAEFLDAVGVRTPLAFDRPTTVVYQDACHLGHGQGVREAPRRLLRLVTGLTLVESADAELCCGSAGLYNLEHPDTAAALGRRKAEALAATGATVIATSNIGCLSQVEAHLQPGPARPEVQHTIEILDSAYSAGASRLTVVPRGGS